MKWFLVAVLFVSMARPAYAVEWFQAQGTGVFDYLIGEANKQFEVYRAKIEELRQRELENYAAAKTSRALENLYKKQFALSPTRGSELSPIIETLKATADEADAEAAKAKAEKERAAEDPNAKKPKGPFKLGLLAGIQHRPLSEKYGLRNRIVIRERRYSYTQMFDSAYTAFPSLLLTKSLGLSVLIPAGIVGGDQGTFGGGLSITIAHGDWGELGLAGAGVLTKAQTLNDDQKKSLHNQTPIADDAALQIAEENTASFLTGFYYAYAF